MKSEYGLDADYFKKKFEVMIRDIRHYTPQELAMELGRLALTADENALCELVDDYIQVLNEQ